MAWMVSDDRFATNPARVANREALSKLIENKLRESPAAVWVDRCESARVPAGLVNDIGEAFALAERLGLDPIVAVGGASGGGNAQVAYPMRLATSPVSYRLRPPRLGEHTYEVLRELGL